MKYKIYDRQNDIYLDLTKYCVNGFGDVMTIKGNVLMNQSDFQVQVDISTIPNKPMDLKTKIKLIDMDVRRKGLSYK